MIGALAPLAQSLGVPAAFVPLTLAGFLTFVLLIVQSVAQLFRDRDS